LNLFFKKLLATHIARPFQTFAGLELLPSILEKAASIIESLLMNHPFIDGNKRTGYVVLRLFLINNGLDILASEDNRYEFVIGIAAGKLKFEEIVHWLLTHTEKIPGG
jgi:death on curing protein